MTGECPWEKIDSFVSPGEFKRFAGWVGEQIASGSAAAVQRPSGDVYIASANTRYIQHVASGQIWRIDTPDGPFKGSFRRAIP